MPHDMNGAVLVVGDFVQIPARVAMITDGETYCNVTLATERAMFPGEVRTSITLNARQVEKVADGKATGTAVGATTTPAGE